MGYLEKTLDYIDKKFYQVKDEKEIYYKNLREQVEKSEIQVCIFGASEIGISLVQDLNKRGIKTKLFVDNDSKKWNKVIYGDVMCYEPQVLNTLSNPVVFLGLTAVNDVEKQLKNMNIFNYIKNPVDYLHTDTNNWMSLDKDGMMDKVNKLFELLEDDDSKKIAFYKVKGMLSPLGDINKLGYSDICTDDEYFPKEISFKDGKDVLIDGGAFNGDTLNEFLALKKPFEKYIAYEMDENNYIQLLKNIENIDRTIRERVITYQVGLAECEKRSNYISSSMSSRSGMGDNVSRFVSLDSHCKEKCTYIKLDVEGMEKEAIIGMRETLKKYHPRCAICVYHKATDLWELPLLLKSIVPEYKLYLKHHCNIQHDTVCYAIVSEE